MAHVANLFLSHGVMGEKAETSSAVEETRPDCQNLSVTFEKLEYKILPSNDV